jgi:hypothetical protein
MNCYKNFYVKSWGPQWPIEEFRAIVYKGNKQWAWFRGRPHHSYKQAFQVKAFGDDKWYLVEESEIQWITSPEAKYMTYDSDSVTMEKIVMNTRWIQLCDNIGNRHGLVLDSIQGLTCTVSLASTLFSTIVVPNFTPGFMDVFAVKDARVNVYPGALYEYLVGESHEATYDVCMDYCCTLYGSEQAVQPRVDLSVLFRKQLLRKKDGVLWLTFSTRSAGNSIARTRTDTIAFVQELSDKYAYRTNLIETGSYGQMCYFLYKTSC